MTSRSSRQPSIVKILCWSYQTWEHFIPDPDLTGTISCKRSGVRFIEVDANFSSRDERERALSEADVVFMLDFQLPNADLNIPKKRRKEVVYILASMESPALGFRKRLRTHPFLDRFNFLWSYNRDLTLHTSYLSRSYLYWHHVQRPALVPFAKKIKSALMITLISNCQPAHEAIGRKSLLLSLIKVISIHNYGKCLKNREFPSNQSDELVLAQYKFIYAVENSLCTDYVSEKWVRGLRVGTIPVVAGVNGFPDYTRFDPALDLPVYVNIARFNSSKDLVEHLKQIGENEKIYSRYMA